MFHTITPEIQKRMDYLYELDQKDRKDGTAKLKRLRQIPPETGKFISLLFASSPEGIGVEIGTSAGYSTLWLSLAAKELNRKIYTFELLEEKIKLAKETFNQAEIEEVVKLVEGDALKNIEKYNNISFCFLDTEKEIYEECYEKLIPRSVKCGILVADNITSHYDALKPFIEKLLEDSRVDALVVPIGKGELVCRVL